MSANISEKKEKRDALAIAFKEITKQINEIDQTAAPNILNMEPSLSHVDIEKRKKLLQEKIDNADLERKLDIEIMLKERAQSQEKTFVDALVVGSNPMEKKIKQSMFTIQNIVKDKSGYETMYVEVNGMTLAHTFHAVFVDGAPKILLDQIYVMDGASPRLLCDEIGQVVLKDKEEKIDKKRNYTPNPLAGKGRNSLQIIADLQKKNARKAIQINADLGFDNPIFIGCLLTRIMLRPLEKKRLKNMTALHQLVTQRYFLKSLKR